MEIARHLMVGESISYAKDEIIHAIEHGRLPRKTNWYAITTAFEPCNLCYIMSGAEFRHPMYHREDQELRLLALAGSRREAYVLMKDMIQYFVDSDSLMEMKTSLAEY